jgi:hypothetical protein
LDDTPRQSNYVVARPYSEKPAIITRQHAVVGRRKALFPTVNPGARLYLNRDTAIRLAGPLLWSRILRLAERTANEWNRIRFAESRAAGIVAAAETIIAAASH